MAKKMRGSIFLCILLVLVGSVLLAYDNSPSNLVILPEVIWAAASGGGTWVSEVQITDFTGGSVVNAFFYYGTGYRSISNIWTSAGAYRSIKLDNILYSLGLIDTTFSYYGRVGTLQLITQDSTHKIHAVARTRNGNFGKSFSSLSWVDANSANLGRNMVIQDLRFNPTYRTFVGFWNGTLGGHSITVQFRIIASDNTSVGSWFTKTFAPWEFKSFNPFEEAGITTGSYENCWLYINVTASGNSGDGSRGLMGFGSAANNYTNDTYALIAVQFQ